MLVQTVDCMTRTYSANRLASSRSSRAAFVSCFVLAKALTECDRCISMLLRIAVYQFYTMHRSLRASPPPDLGAPPTEDRPQRRSERYNRRVSGHRKRRRKQSKTDVPWKHGSHGCVQSDNRQHQKNTSSGVRASKLSFCGFLFFRHTKRAIPAEEQLPGWIALGPKDLAFFFQTNQAAEMAAVHWTGPEDGRWSWRFRNAHSTIQPSRKSLT